MDRRAIEKRARAVQFEIYSNRELLFPLGIPPLLSMFEPRFVADCYGLEFELRDGLPAEDIHGFEAAGILDRRRQTIVISTRFPRVVQRFTAAHELGHYVLHQHIGNAVAHRDRPVGGPPRQGRPQVELEADYFAACLLMPRGLIESEFIKRFGSRIPLVVSEAVAFHLGVVDINPLFASQSGTAAFALAVASARRYGSVPFPSLAEHFGVSPTAMAIRLRELNLVAEYLPA